MKLPGLRLPDEHEFDPFGAPLRQEQVEKYGPWMLNELDDSPGEHAIEKARKWGFRGAIAGAVGGLIQGMALEPHQAANVNRMKFLMSRIGPGTLMMAGFGAALGGGITVAQAVRHKNDPATWGLGGFAAGTVFAMRRGSLVVGFWSGCAVGVTALLVKYFESYKNPYLDKYRWLRNPPPKHLRILDDDGKIIAYPQTHPLNNPNYSPSHYPVPQH